MLKHILVPLDGSALSELALKTAENIIAPDGRIILLSVLELPRDYDFTLIDVPMTSVAARQYTKDEYESAYRRVHDYLMAFSRRLTAKGFSVECVVEAGDPATVINDVANKHSVETVVMTTHGRTGLNRWLFGSVTQKVISHMLRPVLVVPGNQPIKSEDNVPTTKQIPATS